MTIYIPVSVEKELPEVDENGFSNKVFVISDNYKLAAFWCAKDEVWRLASGRYVIPDYWLKPIEVESLIQQVQSFIAPQREDMREYAKEGIISFFNKFLTKNQ